MSEIGVTGLRRSGGTIDDEILSSLAGAKSVRAFREMSENDPIVGAILFAIEKVVGRLEWQVVPVLDEPGAEERAEFVNGCLHDMSDSWDATLSQIMSMLVYGWSFHEVVYKQRKGPTQKDPKYRSRFSDNKIGWRKWPVRAQESLYEWIIDKDGGIQGMKQLDPSGSGIFSIPIDKALLFRTTTQKNNPEGRSLLRSAYTSWFFKKRIQEIEAIGIERDLAGLPVAEVPPEYLSSGATPEQKAVLAAVQDIVSNIKRNEAEGVVFPALYDANGHKIFDLRLLSSGGSRQFDTDKTITRYDRSIAQSMIADFVMLGHESVGSFALGASKVDLWMMSVDAIAKNIAEVVNAHAIPRLLELNGISATAPPQLTYGEVASVDLPGLADFVQKMTISGALTPDEALEQYLRQVAGLPPAGVSGP
jgi:phage gp29-like protein